MKNKIIKSILSPFFILLVSIFIFILLEKVCFIPVIHNMLILLSFTLMIMGQIIIIRKVYKSKIKRIMRISLSIFFTLIMIVSTAIAFIYLILSFKNTSSFTYNKKKYYYNDVSWLDPAYEIYEKSNYIRMKKIGTYRNWLDVDDSQIDEELAKEILIGTISYRHKKVSYVNNMSGENKEKNENLEENENPQEILNNTSLDNVIYIKNSNFALVCVDKAMASSRWFFVQIDKDKLNYISEPPDTSPNVKGFVDSQENIYLKFEDINSNVYKYKSIDSGISWDTIID